MEWLGVHTPSPAHLHAFVGLSVAALGCSLADYALYAAWLGALFPF